MRVTHFLSQHTCISFSFFFFPSHVPRLSLNFMLHISLAMTVNKLGGYCTRVQQVTIAGSDARAAAWVWRMRTSFEDTSASIQTSVPGTGIKTQASLYGFGSPCIVEIALGVTGTTVACSFSSHLYEDKSASCCQD